MTINIIIDPKQYLIKLWEEGIKSSSLGNINDFLFVKH